MKNSIVGRLFAIVVGVLVSCGQPVAVQNAATKPIEPGERIGDFLITTGDAAGVDYTWSLECQKQGTEENYVCQSSVGKKVNVSAGVFAAMTDKSLNTLWSEHTYELFINDRPVNLERFGSIDVTHPRAGAMRHWNVVIVADKPGEINLRDSGVVDGKAFQSTMKYVFATP